MGWLNYDRIYRSTETEHYILIMYAPVRARLSIIHWISSYVPFLNFGGYPDIHCPTVPQTAPARDSAAKPFANNYPSALTATL